MSFGGLVLVWLGWLVCQPTSIDEQGASLEARIAALLPHADEQAWRRIPWRSDLLVARREANAQGKPIFMWIMNGNPLGCT